MTKIANCDDCGILDLLTEHSLCKRCEAAAEIFNKFAQEARLRGHDPFKAGMIAQAKFIALSATND